MNEQQIAGQLQPYCSRATAMQDCTYQGHSSCRTWTCLQAGVIAAGLGQGTGYQLLCFRLALGMWFSAWCGNDCPGSWDMTDSVRAYPGQDQQAPEVPARPSHCVQQVYSCVLSVLLLPAPLHLCLGGQEAGQGISSWHGNWSQPSPTTTVRPVYAV